MCDELCGKKCNPLYICVYAFIYICDKERKSKIVYELVLTFGYGILTF